MGDIVISSDRAKWKEITKILFPKKDRVGNFAKESKFEILATLISAGYLLIAAAIAAYLHLTGQSNVALTISALFFCVFASVTGLIIALVNLIRIIIDFYSKESMMNRRILDRAESERLIINGLRKKNKEELLFVKEHIDHEAKVTKERFGVVVGALDTLGLFPFLATTLFVVWDHLTNSKNSLSILDGLFIGFTLSKVLGIPIMNRLQTLNDASRLLDKAVKEI